MTNGFPTCGAPKSGIGRGWKMPFCRCSAPSKCPPTHSNCRLRELIRQSTSCRKPRTKLEQTIAGSGNPIPDSKIGSGKVQLAAKKLALRVGFSAELVEDAIVPVLNLYREQAMRAITDSIDYVLLNGDTEPGAPATSTGQRRACRHRSLHGLQRPAQTAVW